ncbi:S8 family serine peptidase [Burkholderia sp. Se-20378]|uniref:S8 family serine peptidase n=1 Tax=Burkholderia sp. Se-20378 TaxID=2703899 RepID=UPI00197EFDEB|nr:S8 family serine peptidase [Burkholderia sp. Se-20378]MBN3769269.1 S8 family serine peptidase [Burkholderia sp. Se-20378]
MAADYPLLYVSNPSALQRDRKTVPGGKKTDFYADRDDAFAAHRTYVTNSIRTIQAQLGESSVRFGPTGFVKVSLQEKAWAKSHRPVRRLFTQDTAPVVGGADIGELIVRADDVGLSRVLERIEAADAKTKRRLDKHGDLVLDPNRERSELGALENLHLWSVADRRIPDTESAIRLLNEQKLAPMYSVRFFEPISSALAKLRSASDTLRSADLPADTFVRSLVELSRSLGIYVVLQSGLESVSSAYIGLTDSPGFAVLDGISSLSKVGEQLRVDGDYSFDAHRTLLALLGDHPDIRTVAIPNLLATDQNSTLIEAAAPQRIQRTSTVVSLLPADIPEPKENVAYPTVAVVDGGIADTLSSWVKGIYGGIPENHRDLEHGTYIAGLLVGAQTFNPEYSARLEDDGCWLIDIALQTKDAFAGEYYENGSAKFMDALDQLIGECRRNHSVRVFNFSLNNNTEVSKSDFSEEAIKLDEIARRHDVFFVISAGNAVGNDARPEWHKNTMEAANNLPN